MEKFKSCSLLSKFDLYTFKSNLDYEKIYDIDYDLLFELEYIAWTNDFYREYDF